MCYDPIDLFNAYMHVTGVPTLTFGTAEDPLLQDKTLGIINGSSWISLWSSYFGAKLLPGVKLVQAGNEGVQLNFIEANKKNEVCPPRKNIDLFCQYAQDLVDLAGVDAILITCSTMNRAFTQVQEAVDFPVIQIDRPMMEEAAKIGGTTLIIATHGPTVESTKVLLKETAEAENQSLNFKCVTVQEAFEALGSGDIETHNRLIADAIGQSTEKQVIDSVLLAQLSMSVFSFSCPNPVQTFGIPVFNSGETGFKRAGEVLKEG